MKQLTLQLIAAFAVLLLTCCTGTDDFRVSRGDYDPIDDATVQKLMTHNPEVGDGFNIVIMGDGYSAKDISNGTYHKDMLMAKESLFASGPMSALRDYFDVYEVVATSAVSGITNKEQNTVFKTYIPSSTSTSVESDQKAILQYAATAVGGTTTNLNKTLIVVLLNSSAYAGVTLLACDKNVTDSIPAGYSISFIPARATTQGTNVFDILIQHEAVGHGIGKLADEYYYSDDPASEDAKQFETGHKYGMYMNVTYAPNAQATDRKDTYYAGTTPRDIYSHEVPSSSFFYPLTQDARYAAEGLRWFMGAYTFHTKFYRPSLNMLVKGNGASYISMMGTTTLGGSMKFNAPSRLMIYKRIMKNAKGPSWKCDLTKTEDMEAFTAFDAPFVIKAASAKAATMGAESGNELQELVELPPLPAPRIVE